MKAGHITNETHMRIINAAIEMQCIGVRLEVRAESSLKINALLESEDLALQVDFTMNIDTIRECIERLTKLAAEYEQLQALPE